MGDGFKMVKNVNGKAAVQKYIAASLNRDGDVIDRKPVAHKRVYYLIVFNLVIIVLAANVSLFVVSLTKCCQNECFLSSSWRRHVSSCLSATRSRSNWSTQTCVPPWRIRTTNERRASTWRPSRQPTPS